MRDLVAAVGEGVVDVWARAERRLLAAAVSVRPSTTTSDPAASRLRAWALRYVATYIMANRTAFAMAIQHGTPEDAIEYLLRTADRIDP